MSEILREAKRLFDLGWAVHHIKPLSKVPVKGGWSGPKRDPWLQVLTEYRKGYGLGVRLGEASKVDGGYLANIDVDIKSKEKRHRKEAIQALQRLFPGVSIGAPRIKTGAGFRLVVRTKEPAQSRRLASSPEKVDYCGKQKDAWQVEFMSAGKQVVLPPSIHPDTKKPYLWLLPYTGIQRLPLVQPPGGVDRRPGKDDKPGAQAFTPVEVDLISSELSDQIIEMIVEGTGVEDRSAAVFTVAMAMSRAQFSDDEILSVLTDKENFLGEVGYRHAQTSSRARAAQWVRRFTLVKARRETDAAAAFDDLVVESDDEEEPASPKAVKAKAWKTLILREKDDGPPLKRLENVVLILENAAGEATIKYDSFAERAFYTRNTPWGGKRHSVLADIDAVRIKLWLAKRFRFEPQTGLIYEAMSLVADKNAYHPIREELAALPGWDGMERIDGWLKRHFSARGPDEYLAQVFRKWLVAAVARIYEPGLKFDWMPIFEGAQGTGKSSFGAILFGQNYFTDWLPALGDKDAALALQGKRCAEFGELDQLKRNELETTKAFITRQIDNVRPHYGRLHKEIHRQCVFFGTTNKQEYLKDESGNRRFNPVVVGRLDFEALRRDRVQLWAEALFIYANGLEPSLYLDNGAEAHALKTQLRKMVKDDAHAMVETLKHFREKATKEIDFGKFALLELFKLEPFKCWKADMNNQRLAAKALAMMGGKKRMIRGSNYWGLPEAF